MIEQLTRLQELSNLGDGWHEGVGSHPHQAALAAAHRFLKARPALARAFHIFPTVTGGVLIEFENRGWDYSLEFGAHGTVEMYGVEIYGSGEMDSVLFNSLNEEFLKCFDIRTGQSHTGRK